MQKKDHTSLLIGIDDTDNAESRGTGFHARQLAHALEAGKLGKVEGITRHQLFVDPAIRYTSQNSSACIRLSTTELKEVYSCCAGYLLENSAPGSDAGLCIARQEEINGNIMEWGMKAKYTVLKMKNAITLAREEGICLEGFTGNHEGIIGALAAVGLHAGGNDGRYIWSKGIKELREMEAGIYLIKDILADLDLDEIASLNGERPGHEDRILINDWVRPLCKENKAVLITQRTNNNYEYEWELTGKEIIRTIS